MKKKKKSSIYLKDFTDLDFFFLSFVSFFFFIFFDKCLFTLKFFLARKHLNTMILANFENLNFISKIFQETHDFLVLMDPVITCIYLGTTDRHFRGQGNVRHPISKLLKYDFAQRLNTFRNPSLRIFAAG